jgi:dephospho-CoA kinase
MSAPQSGSTRPFVIGVTGDIACGKSTVLELLGKLGAETINADELYHDLIQPGQPLAKALIDHFGVEIVAPGGGIDRRALGIIVFADPAALAELDRITHPTVIEAAVARIAQSTHSLVAIDAVKLVESGMADHCDEVWLVECDPAIQLERLVVRNGMDPDDAHARIAAIPDRTPVRARASVLIDNSGSRADTRAQVEQARQRLPVN